MPDDVALDKLQCKRSIGPTDCERFHLDVSRIDRMTARFQPRPSEIAMQDYVPEATTIIIERLDPRKRISHENRLWCLFAIPKIHRNGDFAACWQTRLKIIMPINDAFRNVLASLWNFFFEKSCISSQYYKIIGKNKFGSRFHTNSIMIILTFVCALRKIRFRIVWAEDGKLIAYRLIGSRELLICPGKACGLNCWK